MTGRSEPRPRARHSVPAALAAAAALVAIAACSPAPRPSAPTASGTVRFAVEHGPGATELYNSERRARIVAADGSVAFDGALDADGVTTMTVPAGRWVVSAFTVFFADFLVCPDVGPGSPSPSCIQPTLEPARTCDLPVDVTPAIPVEITFTVLSDGDCRITSPAARASG